MTNTMFFGSGERFIGAKNWTKWPSDTWKTHLFTPEGPPSFILKHYGELINQSFQSFLFKTIMCGDLQLPGVVVPRHVIHYSEYAVDGAVCAVVTLSLLLQGGLEDNMSLKGGANEKDTHTLFISLDSS